MATETKSLPAVQPQARIPGELVIEIGDGRNRQVVWPMTKETLRGAWKKANLLAQELTEDTMKIPDIPGLYVVVDARRRVARVMDPLNRGPFNDLLVKIQKVLEGILREKVVPEKDREYPNLTASQVKSWLYWMRRVVESGGASVVSGQLPSYEDIDALPGKLFFEANNNNPNVSKWREHCPELRRAEDGGV